MVGTPSQQLYDKVNDWFEQHQTNGRVYQFNRSRYSSFQNIDFNSYLWGWKIDNPRIASAYADVCALHTAIATHSLNYQIMIPVKGVTAFTRRGREWVLNYFKNSPGATLV